MTVYVDDMRAPFGRMVMCHMIADTRKELLEMVETINVNPTWIQKSGTYYEHFDISLGKKKQALAAGAILISRKELVQRLHARRDSPRVLNQYLGID